MKVFFIIAMLASSGVGARIISPDVAASYQLLRVVAAAVALLVTLRYFNQIFSLLSRERWTALLLIWTLFSVFWSQDPTESVTTLIGLLSVMLLAAGLVIRYGVRSSAKLIMYTYTASSIASMVAIQFLPAISTIVVRHPTAGLQVQANGIFAWNSDFAVSAAIALLLAAALWNEQKRWILAVVFLINLTAILTSASFATLIATASGIALLLIVKYRTWRIVSILVAITALLAISVAGIQGVLQTIFEAFNRSVDLTGRTDIWDATWPEITERPIIGQGAGTQPDFAFHLGREVNHAHNGYLQILFDRGIVGLTLIVGLITQTLMVAIRGHNPAQFVTPILGLVIVANIANSYFTFASLGTLMLFWAVFASRQMTMDQPVKRPPHGCARSALMNTSHLDAMSG